MAKFPNTCALLLILSPFRLFSQTGLPAIVFAAPAGTCAAQDLSPGGLGLTFGTGFGSQPTAVLGGADVQTYPDSDGFLYFQVPDTFSPGPSTFAVRTQSGTSTAVPVMVDAFAPCLIPIANGNGTTFFQEITGPIGAPRPGDRVLIDLNGIGPVTSVDPPTILFDGKTAPILGVLPTKVTSPSGNTVLSIRGVLLELPLLTAGRHTLSVQAGGVNGPQEPFEVIIAGMILSHTGAFFSAEEGGPAPPSQTISVLSRVDTLNFSATTSTLSGGPWLSVSPQSGTSLFEQPGVPLHVRVNPAGLAAGTYYGFVRVSSPDATNSPQSASIVLRVSPAGTKVGASLSTFGLLFTGVAGGADPASQQITITNSTAASLSFTATVIGTPNPFTVAPLSGTIDPGKASQLTATASLDGLAAGSYDAKLKLAFSDGKTQTVDLLLNVSAPASAAQPAASAARPHASGCTPTKLLPVFTELEDSFEVAVAWPTNIEATITDDCNNLIISADVFLSFSNGDPALAMTSNRDGTWAITWAAGNPRTGAKVTLTAEESEKQLKGAITQGGGVQSNPKVPIVNQNGVVDSGAYLRLPQAPGGLVSIYGEAMADDIAGASSLPLDTILLTTSALLAGEQLPLLYTSDGQVNAVLPYDIATNALHQLIVIRNGQISVPQAVAVGSARPAVLTVNSSGSGQGHIYVTDSSGTLVRADSASPAKAGDVLVVFCAGLGPVDPPVAAGAAAPLSPPANTKTPVTVIIGGMNANNVSFAGLSPMSAGLYQVNVQVPAGLRDNDQTFFELSISGQTSPPVFFAVKNPK